MTRLQDFGVPANAVFVDGKWISSAGTDLREIRNPKDGSGVDAVAAGHGDDVEQAVRAAGKAQADWSSRTPMERAALVLELARLIDANAETLARLDTDEGGKLLAESRIDIGFSAALLRYAAESARRLQGEILPGENRSEQLWIQRVPYGVVAGVTAWNFPAALFARKVGPALVTGNAIVLKPHELTPLTTLAITELARQAGLPAGVLNVVLGDGRIVGAQLVSHPDVDLVSMTGSPRAGGEIYALGAKTLKPLRLELGGKAPFIVMDDADIDRAVAAAIGSKFFYGGSVCTCNDRMYVHSRIYDAFMEKFIAETRALRVGDPLGDAQIGPRISAVEVRKLQELSDRAIQQGATPLLDSRSNDEAFARGNWFFPTIFDVRSNDLEIMREETFGPIIAAMRVDDFDEALSYANESEYGLSAFVFTNDNRKIMRCVRELNFGEIYVNRPSGESVHGFHTGYGKSGLGGEDGQHGIEGFLRKKTMYNNFSG